MKGLEELKIQERKIIWKILGSRQTEEGYRLQTKSTTENHSNIEKDIRKSKLTSEKTDKTHVLDMTSVLKSTSNWVTETRKELLKASIKKNNSLTKTHSETRYRNGKW